MKYIRTEDGIVLNPAPLNCGNYDFGTYMGEDARQSDTIEELCDEFVFEDSDGHYLCNLCEQTDVDVDSKFDELVYWFNHSKEEQYKIRNCYGAIWTDKGLIYVAKMKGVLPNGKIDWELL